DGGGRVTRRARRRRPRHLAGLVDLRHRAPQGAAARVRAADARAQALLRRALRRDLLQAGRRADGRALRVRRAAADRGLARRDRPRLARGVGRDVADPDRARPHVRARARERAHRHGRRLPGGPMNEWTVTVLILLPFAGALAIWLLPLSRFATGSLSLFVAL